MSFDLEKAKAAAKFRFLKWIEPYDSATLFPTGTNMKKMIHNFIFDDDETAGKKYIQILKEKIAFWKDKADSLERKYPGRGGGVHRRHKGKHLEYKKNAVRFRKLEIAYKNNPAYFHSIPCIKAPAPEVPSPPIIPAPIVNPEPVSTPIKDFDDKTMAATDFIPDSEPKLDQNRGVWDYDPGPQRTHENEHSKPVSEPSGPSLEETQKMMQGMMENMAALLEKKNEDEADRKIREQEAEFKRKEHEAELRTKQLEMDLMKRKFEEDSRRKEQETELLKRKYEEEIKKIKHESELKKGQEDSLQKKEMDKKIEEDFHLLKIKEDDERARPPPEVNIEPDVQTVQLSEASFVSEISQDPRRLNDFEENKESSSVSSSIFTESEIRKNNCFDHPPQDPQLPPQNIEGMADDQFEAKYKQMRKEKKRRAHKKKMRLQKEKGALSEIDRDDSELSYSSNPSIYTYNKDT